MATPPDVVAGEVIEVEWGNAVRDFACFGVTFGGTIEVVSDTTLTTTYEDGASVAFVPDSDWVQYKVLAWGAVHWDVSGGGSGQCRVVIGASNGTPNQSVVSLLPPSVNHSATGLSGTQTVKIQYREAAGTVAKHGSTINFIAIRTS